METELTVKPDNVFYFVFEALRLNVMHKVGYLVKIDGWVRPIDIINLTHKVREDEQAETCICVGFYEVAADEDDLKQMEKWEPVKY